MKKTVLALSVLALALAFEGCASSSKVEPAHHEKKAMHQEHWNYSDNGPAHWGKFSKICAVGKHQSPINIIPEKTVSMNYDYDLSMHENINTVAKVIDNGHSIKVTPTKGGFIMLHGEKFNLLQFHFHGKSEHTIDGKHYALVAHLVHQNPITKQLAVVAVFFKEGKASPILDTIINNVGKSVKLNPQNLLPANDEDYFHYVGSLTTPPCSQNVQWYLLKTPKTASAEQIANFRKFYADNERPVQELNDRVVESN